MPPPPPPYPPLPYPCPYPCPAPLPADAVGNTIKRVVIILASVAWFRTSMRPLAIVGSTVAIAGTLLYSVAKQYYAAKEASSH